MISFDTNLLLYSLNQDCPEYNDARAFFASLPTAPGTVAICELGFGRALRPAPQPCRPAQPARPSRRGRPRSDLPPAPDVDAL